MASSVVIGRTTAGLYIAGVNRDQQNMTLAGTIRGATAEAYRSARANVSSLAPGQVIVVTHSGDPELDGWYRVVNGATVDSRGTRAGYGITKFTIGLEKVGAATGTSWYSRLGGATLSTGHTVAGPSPFFCPPDNQAIDPDPGLYVGRVLSNGTTLYAYYDVTRQSYRWNSRIARAMYGAAYADWAFTAAGTKYRREGLWCPDVTDRSWTLGNDIVEARSIATYLGFTLAGWNGATWDTWDFRLTTAGAAATPLDLVAGTKPAILRNDPEWVIIGLESGGGVAGGGRRTLTLGIRRGSRFIYGHLQCNTAAQYGLFRSSADAANDRSDGSVEDTTGLPHWAIGTEQARTADTTNGGFYISSGTDLYFYAAVCPGSPSSGDARADIVEQYHGWASEICWPGPR